LFKHPRRTFLQATLLSSTILVLYSNKLFSLVSPHQTLELVQIDLFPFAKDSGVKLAHYMTIVLQHSRITDVDKEFIRDGIKWLNEEAVLKYNSVYSDLSPNQREKVLQSISKEDWGRSWVHSMLTYIMEAMFSDRVYGVNPKEAGAKWLSFEAGYPRPKEALL